MTPAAQRLSDALELLQKIRAETGFPLEKRLDPSWLKTIREVEAAIAAYETETPP